HLLSFNGLRNQLYIKFCATINWHLLSLIAYIGEYQGVAERRNHQLKISFGIGRGPCSCPFHYNIHPWNGFSRLRIRYVPLNSLFSTQRLILVLPLFSQYCVSVSAPSNALS